MVVVAEQTIVTNCHVTRDAQRVDVLRAGLRWRAVAQRSDIDHDLCLLRVPGLPANAVSLGRADDLQPGQSGDGARIHGWQGHAKQRRQGARRASFRRQRRDPQLQLVQFGASGGGLFDDDLRLVGILTFRLRGGEAHYFAAPAEWLLAMLEVPEHKACRDTGPERDGTGALLAATGRRAARFLKAALLHGDDKWAELASLAADWLRFDASDAEPWYLWAWRWPARSDGPRPNTRWNAR